MNKFRLKSGDLVKAYSLSKLKALSRDSKLKAKPIIGQKRALRALKFGLGNKSHGFNVYVSGIPGLGKMTAVKHYLSSKALKEPAPKDWCYVNCFENNYRPKCLSLPQGYGVVFQKDIKSFLKEVRLNLFTAFGSKDYTRRKDKIKQEMYDAELKIIGPINKKAKKKNFIVSRAPLEINAHPAIDGRPMKDEEFLALNEKEQKRLLKIRDEFQNELLLAAKEILELHSKHNDAQHRLDREVATKYINTILSKLRDKYVEEADVNLFFDALQEDILEHLQSIMQLSTDVSIDNEEMAPGPMEKNGYRYAVNVLVDNAQAKGAPIVVEQNPTYNNLFGKVEKEGLQGMLITDFTLIRSGSLHKANGGYLLLPVKELLSNYLSWDSLKRALKNKEIRIEEPEDRLGFLSTRSLKPQPIPLDVQVILTGSPKYFHLLSHHDEDFADLFKVKAEFDTVMQASEENVSDFVSFMHCSSKNEGLLPITNNGISSLLALSHKLAGDQGKLSVRLGRILDILKEANHYALNQSKKKIDSDIIGLAIKEKEERSSMWKEKVLEMIQQDILLIDMTGFKVGQVNGISVSGNGEFSYGRPSRITASVSLGKSDIIDIEREVKLGGPIHSKGVLILKGYLREMFGQDKLLHLSAQLAFEQSYSGIEGDSASSAELYALLSSLSDLPINQGIAVTGSVNQKGQIQPVGGINEKIEGYYEVCAQKGLSGDQGVIIPFSNKEHLVLNKEVVAAVRKKKFHIWAINNVTEGIEILTGTKAGKSVVGSDSELLAFTKGSVFDRVNQKLHAYSNRIKSYTNNSSIVKGDEPKLKPKS